MKNKKFLKKIKVLWQRISVFEILLGVIFLTVLGWIMPQTRSKKEWIKVEVKSPSQLWGESYNSAVPFWLGESINIGDKGYDSQGNKIVEVINKKEYESTSGRPTRKEFYLTLNLKVDKNRKTNKLRFKNQLLEIGSVIELHLTNTYVKGVVIFIEDSPDKREEKEIIIDGVWQDTFPWTAEAIPINGEMKDTAGNITAQILEKEIKLAKKITNTSDGRLVTAYDPLKRDIFIKAKLKVRKQANNLYFYDNQKIRVGGLIWIFLPGIDVERLNIVKIFDSNGKRLH